MKHSFSRFFGFGEKEEEPEIAEHDTNKEEILKYRYMLSFPTVFSHAPFSQMKKSKS